MLARPISCEIVALEVVVRDNDGVVSYYMHFAQNDYESRLLLTVYVDQLTRHGADFSVHPIYED